MQLGSLKRRASTSEEGYILIIFLVVLTLMMIALTAAAPRMAQQIKRDREIEMIHRGDQYSRAIKRYYKKFGRYPGRIEDLENTNTTSLSPQALQGSHNGRAVAAGTLWRSSVERRRRCRNRHPGGGSWAAGQQSAARRSAIRSSIRLPVQPELQRHLRAAGSGEYRRRRARTTSRHRHDSHWYNRRLLPLPRVRLPNHGHDWNDG